MKELLEMIVKAIVDRPQAVEINETVGAHAHILELKVAKEDLGQVIGKRGAMRPQFARSSPRRAGRMTSAIS